MKSQHAVMQKRKGSHGRRVLRVTLTLKGIDGVLELIGGALFLFVKPSTINSTIAFLTRREIAQDRKDFVANLLIHSAQQLSLSTKLVASIYLLAHGIIKIVLVIGLLTERKGFYRPALFFSEPSYLSRPAA